MVSFVHGAHNPYCNTTELWISHTVTHSGFQDLSLILWQPPPYTITLTDDAPLFLKEGVIGGLCA